MAKNASRTINNEVIHQKCITALRISSTLAVLISSTALGDYHPGDLHHNSDPKLTGPWYKVREGGIDIYPIII